jgi:hypothetical protein
MPADLPPLLVPQPRRLTLTGGWVEATPDRAPATAVDARSAPDAQGYRLTVSPRQPHVRFEASSEAGLRHARATLDQLVRQYGTRLPCLVIEDWPAFPTRGVMLDISRDKVPTMTSLRLAIDALAALKLNHLQLYTEHTLAYAGHEEVWRDASPITPDETRELDAYASARGIELAPNQNCFGHLREWLEKPRYGHLAETHGTWRFMHWPRSGPFSLCPIDPGSIELVRDLLGQLLPCFRSSLVNIGCDETFDVGQGRSAAAVAERGRAAVYFEFVRKICELARSHGKRPMLWADIALSHPESLSLFPKDAIGLAWGYEPDTPFAASCDLLRQHGIAAWVCPGTSSWRSITGRTMERRTNIAAAAEQGLRGGATGMLATDWGDYGHHQHWPIALNAFAAAAQAAWNPEAKVDPRAVSLHVFGDRSLNLGAWLDRLGDCDAHIRQRPGTGWNGQGVIRNSSALFLDLYRPPPYTEPVAAPVETWDEAAANIAACGRTLPRGLDELTERELRHTLAVASLAAQHAVASRTGELSGTRHELIAQTEATLTEHHRLWPLRNRPGGLERSSARYQAIIDRLRAGTQ